jgi:hypothetical protein
VNAAKVAKTVKVANVAKIVKAAKVPKIAKFALCMNVFLMFFSVV